MRALLAIALLAAEIPLKSIYTTSPQEGMQPLRRERVVGSTRGGGENIANTSNVWLVDAKSIDAATNATRRVLSGRQHVADRLAKGGDDPTGHYWFVVFLGTAGSHPIRWTADGVKIDDNRIRFTYHPFRPPAGGYGGTGDRRYYFYLIPVGQLLPGKYRLQLFDGEDVTLMRQVEVRAE